MPMRGGSVPSTPPTVHAAAPHAVASYDVGSPSADGHPVTPLPNRGKIQRTSWWKALLRSAQPASSDEALAARRRRAQARVAALFTFLSLASVAGALVIGLRAASVPGSTVPALAITMIASRTLIAVGLIAYALALVNVVGRVYPGAGRPARDDSTFG
jgi:hypothetical protein